MDELKPCPFCGGEAIRTKTENTLQDTVWGCYHYGVSCADPNCIGFDIVPRYRTYASADEAWNRRLNDAAIDAVPVVHGHWIDGTCGCYKICSECDQISDFDFDYCPHCGAKMECE